MKRVAWKYFNKDKNRNTFIIMLFLMVLLLSIAYLVIHIYDYNLKRSQMSSYFNVTIKENDYNTLKKPYVDIVKKDKIADGITCTIRVLPDDYDKFIQLLNELKLGYGEFDNEGQILNLIKFKPIIIASIIAICILIFLMILILILRKFKREEVMRSNLNNIGANTITLLKLDSVYVWVFILLFILNSVIISIGLYILGFSRYFIDNIYYIYASIGIIHIVILILYFIILSMNIKKIKS